MNIMIRLSKIVLTFQILVPKKRRKKRRKKTHIKIELKFLKRRRIIENSILTLRIICFQSKFNNM